MQEFVDIPFEFVKQNMARIFEGYTATVHANMIPFVEGRDSRI